MNTIAANSLRLLPAVSNLQGGRKVATWALQVTAAAILAMTLPAKFSGAEGPVRLFNELGAGSAGLYGTAALETLAVVLLLTPRLAVLGAGLAAGLMSGAVFSHLTTLGIKWDGSYDLFAMALIALTSSVGVLALRRRELPLIGV